MDSHQLSSSRTFSHSKIYAAWETDETIAKELWRNMGLAMMCVFVINLLLLANVKICVLVLLCVILTLVDIVGMLHFWGITIDTLSCVNIVLAIGLCVDYSAHITSRVRYSQSHQKPSKMQPSHRLKILIYIFSLSSLSSLFTD